MGRGIARCFAIATLTAPLAVARADTFRVPFPVPTIAEGLAVAAPGDTVLLACGTYVEHDLVLPAGVVLRSESGSPDCATIDAQQSGRILKCTTSADPASVEGLTLRGGYDTGPGGAVAQVDGSGLLTFRDCSFRENESRWGAVARSYAGSLAFERCSFEEHATYGAVVYAADTHVSLRDCVVSGNPELRFLEAILGSVEVTGCTFADNHATSAPLGLILASRCPVTVRNCVFRRNRQGQVVATNATTIVEDCDFGENPGVSVIVDGGTVTLARCGFADGGDCAIRLEDCTAELIDCSVFRGTADDWRGGGLLADGATVGLTRCHFEANEAFSHGGAVYARDGQLTATECTFRGNVGSVGGAVRVLNGGASFAACRFEEGNAWEGAGIAGRAAQLILQDCIFRGNSTRFHPTDERGAAVSAWGGSAVMENCTVVSCLSPDGSIVWMQAADFFRIERSIVAWNTGSVLASPFLGSFDVECSVFYGNDDPEYPDDVGRDLPEGDNAIADPAFCDADSGDLSLRANSRCAAARSPCGQRVGALDVGCAARGVYLESPSNGLVVLGDGESRVTDAWFDWAPGSSHEISVAEQQEVPPGILYSFREWSDGGDRTHTIMVEPAVDAVVAHHDSLFRLTTESIGGGSITPASAWLMPFSTVDIAAIADSGWAFLGWSGFGSGSYSGPAATATVTLNRPVRQVAEFRPARLLTITSEPSGVPVRVDGESHVTPVALPMPRYTSLHYVEVDSLVTLQPGRRARFQAWNVGGGPGVYVDIVDDPVQLHVVYGRECALTFEPVAHVECHPGDSWHPEGSDVEISADTEYGLDFVRWIGTGAGSYSGTDNPATVSLSDPVHERPVVQPSFAGDGLEMTISASETDPYATVGTPTGAPRSLHLWVTCSERGLSALQMGVDASLPVFGFSPAPQVLNAGSPTDLLLAVGGCPVGTSVPRRLGHWTVLDTGGALCVGPSGPDSVFATVDCDPITPGVWSGPRVTGFASDGTGPCVVGHNVCQGPTELLVSGMAAEIVENAVILSWNGSDVPVDRFRVSRTEVGAPDPVLLTGHPTREKDRFRFRDEAVGGDREYQYVVVISTEGAEFRSAPLRVTTPRWPPRRTGLEGIVPNPATGRVDVRFALGSAGHARVAVYDVAGRLVDVLLDAVVDAGSREVTWRWSDGHARIPAGVYFVRLEAPGMAESRKVTILGAR